MAEELNKHVPHGFGIMVSPSKDVYIGTFVHGLREGHGAYVSFNKGTCTYGQWHNDKENGFCTTVYGYFKQQVRFSIEIALACSKPFDYPSRTVASVPSPSDIRNGQ